MKLKVIALSVSGRGNNIYKAGDIIESNKLKFPEQALEGGFVEEYKEDKVESNSGDEKSISEMTVAELEAKYAELFNPSEEEAEEFADIKPKAAKAAELEKLIEENK